MRRLVSIMVASLALAGLGACGKKTDGQGAAKADGTPAWVARGSGAFGGEKRVFYGVGSVAGIKNMSLARATAENRARAEISKIFEVYSASLMKDYMASTTAGDMRASSEEQHVESAIKTFSANTLSGVTIADHWIDPQGGHYALARLDLDGVGKALDQAKELNSKVRDYVRKNAEKSFDALAKEEDKRSGQPAPAPEPAPAPPPQAEVPATETPFGSSQKTAGALRVRVYPLPEGTSRLPDFATLKPLGELYATRIDVPSRSFDTGFPGISDRFEWFAVRYDGEFEVAAAGSYAFRVLSDDGSKLYIDGKLVIENDGVHPPTDGRAEVKLGKGTHTLVLEYFQGPRFYIALQLFTTPPGGTEEIFATR